MCCESVGRCPPPPPFFPNFFPRTQNHNSQYVHGVHCSVHCTSTPNYTMQCRTNAQCPHKTTMIMMCKVQVAHHACRHCSSTLHKLHNMVNLQLQLYTAQQHNRHWIVNTNSRFALQQGITARPNSQNHNSQPLHLSSTVLQHQRKFNTANNLMVLSSYRYTTYYISYIISHI